MATVRYTFPPPVSSAIYDGGSKRTWAMLFGRDISTPESNPKVARPTLAEGQRQAA